MRAIHRLEALSSIAFFLVLSYALLMIANEPITGYELSIYSATPAIFWIAIIFGLFNGLFIIASNLYRKTGKIWMLGLFQIILCNSLVISLYALRGYVLYLGRGDVSTYVGFAKDISEFGNIGFNLYPITSILISQLNKMTGISNIIISKYLPSMFFIIYFLSIYCWSKFLIPDRKFVLCSMMASTPIFFAWFSTSIYHQVLSVFMLPLFFYILQKNSDYRFKLFSIIFIIMYPFFHPIIGIAVLLYLTVFFISEKLNIVEKNKNVSISLLLLSFIALVAWFIQQYSLLRNIRIIFYQLVGLLKNPTASDLALSSARARNAIQTLGLMITDEVIFSLISLIVIYQLISRKEISIVNKFSKISFCFIIGNLFLLVFFFSTRAHNPGRLINLNFNMILTPPFVGYLLYKFLLNNKRAKTVLILCLIFVSTFTAVFTLYPSPITLGLNAQVTTSDIKGMNWLIIHKDTELKTADILSPVYRFADLIYGYRLRVERNDLRRDLIFPDHFGFTEDNLFPIDEDRYLVITKFDVMGLTEVLRDLDRFGKEDFIKVDFCVNVDKIYENGEFRSYLVYTDD